jgi:Holliday junction resolvasome RuvABC endonuclease subunit
MGLDISSSTIGWAVLNDEAELLGCGYIKPKNGKSLIEERIDSAISKLKKIFDKYKPNEVVIEEIIQTMGRNTTANTIIILAAFNRSIGYMFYRWMHKPPNRMMASTIRKHVREFLGKKGRMGKDDIYDEMKNHFPSFVPELINRGKNKGMERKENFDVADAIAAALAQIASR